jgi:hypothetical protein
MTTLLPKNVRMIMLAGAMLSACGAVWVGMDLYSGIEDGIFHLVRGQPVTSTDTFRYWLLAFGESLAVLTLLGITIVFAVLMKGRTPRG